MKKFRLLGFVLTLCLCFAIAMPAFAVETDEFGKVMPSDVINMLNGFNTLSKKDINENEPVLNTVLLEPSLDITIPRLNYQNIHMYKPLGNSETDIAVKEELREHGYSDDEIAEMDLGDYLNLSPTWIMSQESIEIAKRLHPELTNVDLNSWTNGDFSAFVKEKIFANNAPTNEQILQFEARNIKQEDMQFLLKNFDSYDNILEQTDEVLKESLESYYQFLYDNLALQASLEQGIEPLYNRDLYVEVESFSGYKYQNDLFLEKVGTHIDKWRYQQQDMVAREFKALYNTSKLPTNYYTTNLYGTLSTSVWGAHEGIDFAYGSSSTEIYNMITGEVKEPYTYHQLRIYDANTDKTYSYLHMSKKNFITGDTISSLNTCVGKQGNEGANSSGVHVHFEVHEGDVKDCSPGNDDKLGSISPYQMHNLPM